MVYDIYVSEEHVRKAEEWAQRLAEEADKANCEELVYFIAPEQGGPVKIGITKDIRKRFATIQSHSPYKLDIISVAPGGRELESHLHTMFFRERLHGEWFEPSERVMWMADTFAVRWIG